MHGGGKVKKDRMAETGKWTCYCVISHFMTKVCEAGVFVSICATGTYIIAQLACKIFYIISDYGVDRVRQLQYSGLELVCTSTVCVEHMSHNVTFFSEV